MTSPITIGTTAIVVLPVNNRRADVRMQNTGTSSIYIKRIPLGAISTTVSSTDYEVLLGPSLGEAGESEAGEPFVTDSVAAFVAVSSAANGKLAIFETNNIRTHG